MGKLVHIRLGININRSRPQIWGTFRLLGIQSTMKTSICKFFYEMNWMNFLWDELLASLRNEKLRTPSAEKPDNPINRM